MSATEVEEPSAAPAEPESRAPRRDRASLPERLFPQMPSHGWRGWVGPIIVTVIGGLIRLIDLGRPHAIIFDETYYPKDALAMLRYGYEMKTVEDANDILLAGKNTDWRTIDIFTTDPNYVVHPPLGKWTIAMGEYLFGATPFGWRFAVAVLGTLSILMTARIARRLTRSDLIGTLAGLLLAVEGMHIVMSRTGLLDMVLMFWVLAAFGLLLIDRDHVRRRLGRRALAGEVFDSDWGPRLGLRPWRWAAALALGLACSVKWSGLWFLAFFILMTVVWDVSTRRVIGVRWPWRATIVRDAVPTGLVMVAIAVIVYIGSWTGWLVGDGGYARTWAAGHPPSLIPEALRSLWHYHAEAWRFHVGLSSPHPYGSNALSWFLQARPTSFYYEAPKAADGCPVDSCSAAVTALGNPLIWWFGIVAVIHQAWRWIGRRDWRSGAVLVGIAAGWVPWLIYLDRTIFTFYVVVFVPFLVMAVAMTLGTILGPADAPARRRRDGAVAVTVLVLAFVIAAWWFYPVWTGETIPYSAWRLRMWFSTWV